MMSEVHLWVVYIISSPPTRGHWTVSCRKALGLISPATSGVTSEPPYRGTSIIRKCTPLGPYRRPMPRVLGGS